MLENGGVILHPTDSIWGLGCDAFQQEAVEHIYRIKARRDERKMILLQANEEALAHYVDQIPPVARHLICHYPKPVALVHPKVFNLPEYLMHKDGSVAIRVVRRSNTHNSNFCHSLLESFGKPLISTSANFSEQPPPLKLEDVDPAILGSVDHVVEKDLGGTNEASALIRIMGKEEYMVIRK